MGIVRGAGDSAARSAGDWLGDSWNALKQPTFRRLFFVALAGNLLSKSGALLPGMAPDDYFFSFPIHDASGLWTFVAQGRGLDLLLVQGAAALGLSLVSIQVPAMLLAMVTVSLFIAAAVNAVAGKSASITLTMCAAAVAATHPYLSSYFLFRMIIVIQALAYAALFVATWVLSCERLSSWRKFIICTGLITVWCHSTQMVLLIFGVTGMAWALAQGCRALDEGRGYGAALRALGLVAGILACSALLYFASAAWVRHATGVEAAVAYTPRLAHGLGGMITAEGRLARELLAGKESVTPPWLKGAFFVVLAMALGAATRRRRYWGAAGLMVLVAGMLVTVLPMALSWGGYVPRTFSTLGVVLALGLALAANAVDGRAAHRLAVLFCPFVLIFSLISGTLFYQQMLLTNWDQRTASGVYHDATASGFLAAGRKLRVVTRWPSHSQILSIDGQGVNESALQYAWSYPGLFAVASGEPLPLVTSGDPALCKGYPVWPAPGAIRLVDDHDVYACLR